MNLSDLHAEAVRTATRCRKGSISMSRWFTGDIGRGAASVRWILGQRALRDRPALFVAGNHEHNRGILEDVAADIRNAARGTNVVVMDADAVPVIDGVRFLGCTIWTDYMFGGSLLAGLRAGMGLNDYRAIRTSGDAEMPEPFTPKQAFARHWRERQWLIDRLAEDMAS